MTTPSRTPSARAWQRFKRNRLGFWSLIAFCTLVLLSLFAEVISNDRPLLVRYQGEFYVPVLKDYSEKTFGGDFEASTDYLDPFIRERLNSNGNWALQSCRRWRSFRRKSKQRSYYVNILGTARSKSRT